jgi:hypothetical protein
VPPPCCITGNVCKFVAKFHVIVDSANKQTRVFFVRVTNIFVSGDGAGFRTPGFFLVSQTSVTSHSLGRRKIQIIFASPRKGRARERSRAKRSGLKLAKV